MKRVITTAALAVALAGPVLAQGTIPIASIGPMTGQYASFGAQFKAGAEMAVADINAAGGVNGKKLELIIEDDACDPKQAVAAAGKLAARKVQLVAGHFCSGSSIPSSKVYAEEGIIQISPASTNPKLTDERAGPNVFRVCGRDDQQGAVAGKYLADKFKGKKVAILHDKTAYGKGLADETQKAMNAAGLKEVMYEPYTAGEKDYRALVSKMKAANIDVAYLGGYHTEGGLIVRQMREQGMKTDPGRRRRARHPGVLADHRRGRRRHADDVLARSAQEQGGRRRRQALPGQEDRSRRLRALHLRRDPGVGAGRDCCQDRGDARPSSRSSTPASSTPCSASSRSTRRAIRTCRPTPSTSGRPASTSSSN